VLRTITALDRLIPSELARILPAWYATFIIAADDFPDPTGPDTNDMKLSHVKNGTSVGEGL
jgi:hypothetical protein